MKNPKRSCGWVFLGALASWLGACDRGDGAAKPQRLPPLVRVARPTVLDVPVTVRAPVDLRPLQQAELHSKQLGYLSAVLVDRGDPVKQGQLLALVRPSELPDQLEAARGTLQQAQAQLSQARENRARAGALAPDGVVSTQELQQSGTSLAQAEAAESAARASLQALAVRLGETRLLAPLDGVVLQRRVDPGALVGPQTGAVLTVGRIDTLRIFVAVRERDAAQLRLGQSAAIEVDARPGETFSGQVVRLSPGFDPGTRTLEAEVHLKNPDGALRPGMYGRATIRTGLHPRALVLPEEAVQLVGEQRFVYVAVPAVSPSAAPAGAAPAWKAERRRVTLGVDGGAWLEITQGVRPEDDVITAGIDALADGSPVRAQRDAGPAAKAPSPPQH